MFEHYSEWEYLISASTILEDIITKTIPKVMKKMPKAKKIQRVEFIVGIGFQASKIC